MQQATTKRSILHAVADLYDPLGLISPVTLPGKLLLQKLWKARLSWDEPVPQQYLDQWKDMADDFSQIPSIQLPRFVDLPGDEATHQLVCFCDASKRA